MQNLRRSERGAAGGGGSSRAQNGSRSSGAIHHREMRRITPPAAHLHCGRDAASLRPLGIIWVDLSSDCFFSGEFQIFWINIHTVCNVYAHTHICCICICPYLYLNTVFSFSLSPLYSARGRRSAQPPEGRRRAGGERGDGSSRRNI